MQSRARLRMCSTGCLISTRHRRRRSPDKANRQRARSAPCWTASWRPSKPVQKQCHSSSSSSSSRKGTAHDTLSPSLISPTPRLSALRGVLYFFLLTEREGRRRRSAVRPCGAAAIVDRAPFTRWPPPTAPFAEAPRFCAKDPASQPTKCRYGTQAMPRARWCCEVTSLNGHVTRKLASLVSEPVLLSAEARSVPFQTCGASPAVREGRLPLPRSPQRRT
mmetsp:Transcript_26819/g.47765  ORF Transcript_26819/g.47765 Transcript_26819/m.47765 type:complete len:220 (-) Transcript_26819:680-1339(-)